MKKLKIYLMLFLLSSGIVVFNSCSKEDGLEEQESIQLNDGITLTNGMLTFATVDLYDETIQLLGTFNEQKLNSWEKAYNYASLRSTKEEPELVKEIGNTFATLLNPEKEIIIAGNQYELDFDKETISKKKIDESCELINQSNTFYFKDDVNIFDENPLLKSSDYTCPYGGRLMIERNTLANGHANYRLEYDSWAIFRHVRAEIEPSDYPVRVWLFINDGAENRWNPRSKDECRSLSANISLGGNDGSSSNISYDIYTGTQLLSAFDFRVTFSARSQTTPYDDKDSWDASLDCETVICPN